MGRLLLPITAFTRSLRLYGRIRAPDRTIDVQGARFPDAQAKKRQAAALVKAAGLPLTINAVMHRQNIAPAADDPARSRARRVPYRGRACAVLRLVAAEPRRPLADARAQLGEATAIVETARDRCRFLPCQAATLASSGAGLSSTSSFQHVAKGAERPQPIRDDLDDRQHGNRQNRAGYAPHPVPEDQREDDSDRIDGEAPS